ncbi:toll/interleukin-1 receptor domain-containing protein [Mesorhizobium australicum]|uniref:toll/interleukin-1 receptor domain-containing protein n=1 Tax=Mesorhizobium australicum TaxID=536018 RepID=UPI0033363B88
MLVVREKPDVFISHASPDKATFVRPLAEALRKLGVAVWYDEFSLELGDSISQQIDRGIASSRFGIVVVSPAFISRNWTQHELHALVSRDVDQDIRILPVWHGVTRKEVSDFSPSLADKVAIDTSHVDAMEAAIRILRTVRPDLYSAHPRAELERLASGAAIAELQAGGSVDRPCPQDPRFPKFDDYEVVILPKPLSGAEGVTTMARPKTDMARKLRLNAGVGATEQEARARLLGQFRYAAGEISNAEWFKATVG